LKFSALTSTRSGSAHCFSFVRILTEVAELVADMSPDNRKDSTKRVRAFVEAVEARETETTWELNHPPVRCMKVDVASMHDNLGNTEAGFGLNGLQESLLTAACAHVLVDDCELTADPEGGCMRITNHKQ
jgi:hypothetical protein